MSGIARHARSLLLAALAPLIVPNAFAERWKAPEPRDFASANGAYQFSITPIPGQAEGGNPYKDDYWQGELVRIHGECEAERLWQAPIGYAPVGVMVANGGQVVFIDAWARAGHGRSLVVHSPKGDELASLTLEDFLTSEEIKEHVGMSQSSRFWTHRVAIALEEPLEGGEGPRRLALSCEWGPAIHVSLEDGSVSREEASPNDSEEKP